VQATPAHETSHDKTPNLSGSAITLDPERIRALLPNARLAEIVAAYTTLLPIPPSTERHLAGCLRDVLAHPGSLVRAQLVFALLEGYRFPTVPAHQLAVAVEYFHTASLLFDDLPSMDDATERRGHPCPHRVWGESAATLAALAFVAQGYALLWRVLATLTEDRRLRAAELVGACLGLRGILNGQALDLHYQESDASAEAVERIADGKTVPLIRLTLLLPGLVAGVDRETEARLERLAVAWGHAYQILDDFKDCLWSSDRAGKSTSRDETLHRPNLVHAIGQEAATQRVLDCLEEARRVLDCLQTELPEAEWKVLRGVQAQLRQEATALGRTAAPDREATAPSNQVEPMPETPTHHTPVGSLC
jgi:geranylgeranyl pyrophosphate synthase